ncbi:hypothetical protein OJF2_34800 [Aquisphaera giovannonii]|uniref:Uncharacterized protein n=1 Tax=Aquisphaera giovannonii TaxID=406548 RepID=A0A5B9W4A3_9BACT|nr:hypothetical protein [Aquisphaera giovannonii]QEH34935.1 hypothetical protein OJF2_34800 [Aquisphaera giovannonii]
MRNTHRISQLGREASRIVLAVGLCVCSWGCHQHYHYYGTPPPAGYGCPPAAGAAVVPSAVATGPVCEVPAEGSTMRSSTIGDGRSSRVVVSEPSRGKSFKFGWRPTDPDEAPTITQVDGTLDGNTVKK